MSSKSRAPQATEWNDAVEVLHGLTNAVMVRQLYAEGHPAIERADLAAASGFGRLLARLPELVLALLDGEFVLCERPMPELRSRLSVLGSSMTKLEVDCIVVSNGLSPEECTVLARTLAAAQALADTPKRLREEAQTQLPHALLRFAELKSAQDDDNFGTEAMYFVPLVARALSGVTHAIRADVVIDQRPILDLAERFVRACTEGLFLLEPVAYAEGENHEATHATNVALMTAAMAVEARLGERTCIDVTAAAIVHDIGLTLLPDDMRGIPEPLLTEDQRAIYRHHAWVGGSALLCGGCPPLWVAAALEHHRGVDGNGYPKLASKGSPDPLVRIIALASFIDSKRTRAGAFGEDSDAALHAACALENRFFGARELRLFTRALGPFPPGTTVELSDRSPAIVVRNNRIDALRPQVRLLSIDGTRKRTELQAFDTLDDRHHLSIVRAIPPPLFEHVPDLSELVDEPQMADAVDITVIEAVEASDLDLDMPVSLPPGVLPPWRPSTPRIPMHGSGSYSSVRTTEVPESRDSEAPESLRIAPPRASSIPPPFSRPPMPASLRPEAEAPALSLEMTPVLRLAAKDIAKLPLDHHAGFVLSLIDGMSSLESIIDASGLPADVVLQIVQQLIAQSVVALR